MEQPSTSFNPVSQASSSGLVHSPTPTNKSVTAYRTISEAAEQLGVPQHVLRFWETKFPQIRPMKRSGGRRYYRPQDLATLGLIQNLLYGQGYTIKGVQRLLKQRRSVDELANMDQSALGTADQEQPHALPLDLDELVLEVGIAAAALDEVNAPSQLALAMADVLSEIPSHLPARPAALMAAGIVRDIEAGRPYPPAVQLVNAAETLMQDGLAIEQRLRLESLLEELLSLKAEFC